MEQIAIRNEIKTLCRKHSALMKEYNASKEYFLEATRERRLKLQREIIDLGVQIEKLQDELDAEVA